MIYKSCILSLGGPRASRNLRRAENAPLREGETHVEERKGFKSNFGFLMGA